MGQFGDAMSRADRMAANTQENMRYRENLSAMMQAAKAAEGSAASSHESNEIAREANEIAKEANAKSDKANQIASEANIKSDTSNKTANASWWVSILVAAFLVIETIFLIATYRRG